MFSVRELGTQDARRIIPAILYNNKDISSDLRPFLKSISFTDNLGDTADDLQITLENKDGLWSGGWFPEKGASLDLTITALNWNGLTEGETSMHPGIFEIDEISCSFSPSEVQLKAVSIPNNTTLRGEEHTRSWEKVTLKKIVQDIAEGAKLETVFEVEEEIQLDRTEQTSESDLAFLVKLCQDHGLAVKVTCNQIVVFDEIKYEQQEPKIAIDKNTSNIISASFSSKLRDIYKACHVKYRGSQKKEYIEATYTDPNKKEGKTLEIKEEVKTIAEAEKLAKRRLREKNRDEWTGSLTLLGDFRLLATETVNISGFGVFDGKYIITKADHSIGSGYTTAIDIRRCLDGY